MIINMKHKKTIAMLISVLLIVSLLLSMIYIAKEANHFCIGESCPVCARIQMAEKAINQLGSAFVSFMHLCFALAILYIFIFGHSVGTVFPTLITQNIRMNN